MPTPGEEYSYPADVWGLGLTLMACALGRCPYDHSNYWDLLQSLRESAPPELPPAQARFDKFDRWHPHGNHYPIHPSKTNQNHTHYYYHK